MQNIPLFQDEIVNNLYTEEIQNFVSLPGSIQPGYNFEEKVLVPIEGYRPRSFTLGNILDSLQIKDTVVEKESLDFTLYVDLRSLCKNYYPKLKIPKNKEINEFKLSIPRPLYSKGMTYLQSKFDDTYEKIKETNDLNSVKYLLKHYVKSIDKQIGYIPQFANKCIEHYGGVDGENYLDLRYYFSIFMDFSKAMRDWSLDTYGDMEKIEFCDEFVSFNDKYLLLSMHQLEYLLLLHEKELNSEVITIETQKLFDNIAMSPLQNYFEKISKPNLKNDELILMLLEEVRR